MKIHKMFSIQAGSTKIDKRNLFWNSHKTSVLLLRVSLIFPYNQNIFNARKTQKTQKLNVRIVTIQNDISHSYLVLLRKYGILIVPLTTKHRINIQIYVLHDNLFGYKNIM